MTPTHEVTNQVPPLIDYDAAEYAPILEALHREGASDALEEVHRVGVRAGSAQAQEWGDLAEEHPPVLRTHDRYGNRIDEVRYGPAYHQLMSTAVELGLHGAPWADPDPHAHLVRAAKMAVWGQTDAGHGCPISMTYAVVPALRHNTELAEQYEPLLTARHYVPELKAPLPKPGLIAGPVSPPRRENG